MLDPHTPQNLLNAGLSGEGLDGFDYPPIDNTTLALADKAGDGEELSRTLEAALAAKVDTWLRGVRTIPSKVRPSSRSLHPFMKRLQRFKPIWAFCQDRLSDVVFGPTQNPWIPGKPVFSHDEGMWKMEDGLRTSSVHVLFMDPVEINGASIQRLEASFSAALALPECSHFAAAIEKAIAQGLDHVPLAWLSNDIPFAVQKHMYGVYLQLFPEGALRVVDRIRPTCMAQRPSSSFTPNHKAPLPSSSSAPAQRKTRSKSHITGFGDDGYSGVTGQTYSARNAGHRTKGVNEYIRAIREHPQYDFPTWHIAQVCAFDKEDAIPGPVLRLIEFFVITLTASPRRGGNKNYIDWPMTDRCPRTLIVMFFHFAIRDILFRIAAVEASNGARGPGFMRAYMRGGVEWARYSDVVEDRATPAAISQWFYGEVPSIVRLVIAAGMKIPVEAWGGEERTPIGWRRSEEGRDKHKVKRKETEIELDDLQIRRSKKQPRIETPQQMEQRKEKKRQNQAAHKQRLDSGHALGRLKAREQERQADSSGYEEMRQSLFGNHLHFDPNNHLDARRTLQED
ncbi:hypothetical protein B0H14DRAFT_1607012 [Mycena olivaceomarginata]|nr:hypothetical protein B0H14DRAFT_1607012 [Mycena olivaceomarginata]